MKNLTKILLFSILLWSCEDNINSIEETNLHQEESLKSANRKNLVVKKLIQNGTNYEDILEGEDFFHVKDLLFRKNIDDYDYLDENNLIPYNKQYREEGIISLFNLDITVYLAPSLRNVYLNGLLQAIERYNNINNCGLFLEYSTSPSSTIVIDPKYSSEEYWGKAEFPTKNRPGHQVYINTRIDGASNNQNARMELFLHEIGHCLGLRHTNWSSNGEGSYGGFWDFVGIRPDSPVHIPGTPVDEIDTNSIMWSSINTGFVGFSNFDIIALRNLYPHAYRFREVLNYRNYSPDGEREISEDVYADVFNDASYTEPLILTNTTTARYYKVTQEYNASSGISCSPRNRTLAPGNSSYFLSEIREECSPYQGEVCTRQYLSASYCN